MFGIIFNTCAGSKPRQAGNIVLDLKISRHPHPNFGIKENRLSKVGSINEKLTLCLACGFICHS